MARPSVEPWLGLSMTGTLPTHATRGVRVSPEVLAEAFYASCRYLLRVILAGVDGSKGDIIDAVLLTAISAISTRSRPWVGGTPPTQMGRRMAFDVRPPCGHCLIGWACRMRRHGGVLTA